MNSNDDRPRRPRHAADRPRPEGIPPYRGSQSSDQRREPPHPSKGKYSNPSRPPNWKIHAIAGAVVLLAVLLFLLTRPGDGGQKPGIFGATQETVEPDKAVATATMGSMGDLVMHRQLLSVAKQEDGSYNFDYLFKYMGNYIQGLNWAAVNLETTLGGPDCGTPYQGNPRFNTPDALLDSLKAAGYDMLLTANNHCGDTQSEGLLRTLDVAYKKELATLGTYRSAEEPHLSILELDGIMLGLVNYTFAANVSDDGRPSLDAHEFLSQKGLVNFFTENNLPKFYSEISGILQQMDENGVNFKIVYLHWGQEYQLGTTYVQQAMAQKLCDMGVDVIIGSHPHVVEPIQLLTASNDPSHKTVCLYSMGNFVSNQRRTEMRLNTGHTEDGLMFNLTFERYSDGRPYLLSVDVLPTWVKMDGDQNNPQGYYILPLDKETEGQWQSLYELSDSEFLEAQASYRRTMDIVGPGLLECNDYLTQKKADREQFYWDLANNPEKFSTGAATEPVK